MPFHIRPLLSGVFLLICTLISFPVAAEDFGGLSYEVYRQKDYVYAQGAWTNPWPGIVLRAKPKTVMLAAGGLDISLLQFPLEPDLQATNAANFYGVCQLQQFRLAQKSVPDSTLGQKFSPVLSVNGDWNGDGLTDLFFIAEVQVFVISTQPRYCGFQLVNRGPDYLPEVKTATAVANTEDPYALKDVDHLEAKDIDGDGRDDLILHYQGNEHIPAVSYHANEAGELFGAGAWNAAYVPPASLLDSEVPEADLLPRVTGATAGSHTVGVDGSASYTIPIVVPPAAGGQLPGLSLSYNSNGGNGQLGFGWQLGGLSKVHRCGRTQRQDGRTTGVDFSAEDQLCLDGQRLVLVAGKHGESGSEYRLENEVLAKVVMNGSMAAGGSGAGMVLQAPDGSVSTYGQVIVANGGNSGVPMEWLLTETCDRWKNCSEFHYQVDREQGSYRLVRVDYGGNRNGMPTAHTNRIELAYRQRSGGYRGFVSGSMVTGEHLLETVTVYEQQQRLRFYALKYTPAANNNVLYLSSVTECSGSGQCLQPTTFEWAQSRIGFDVATEWLSRTKAGGRSMASSSHESVPNELPQHEFVLDLNGDARADRLWKPASSSDGHLYVALSNGTEWVFQPTPWLDSSKFSVSSVSRWGARETFGDMNGDGLPDYIWQPADKDNSIYVALNNGNGFDAPYEALAGTASLKLYWSTDTNNEKDNGRFETFVDLTGDGRLDKVWRPQGKNDYYIARANAAGRFDSPVKAYESSDINVASFSFKGMREAYVDVTGDGYPDKVWFPRLLDPLTQQTSSSKKLYVARNIADATGRYGVFAQAELWLSKADTDGFSTIYEPNPGREGYADLNGDGLADRWWLLGAGAESRMYVALSNGRDAFSEPQVWLQSHPLGGININSENGKSRYFMDVNDDGYLDYVWRPSDSGSHLYVALSTGFSFMAPQVWMTRQGAGVVLSSSSNVYESFADVDGDGLADRIWIPDDGDSVVVDGVVYRQGGGRVVVSRNLARRASELAKVTNGFGHETIFRYAPLTDPAVYTKNDPDPELNEGIDYSQRPAYVDARRVVQAVETSNGVGGYQRTGYYYANARINTAAQQSLGFGKIVATNETTGLSDTTIYSQDDGSYKEGLIRKVLTQYTPAAGQAAVLLSKTENSWDVLVNDIGSAGEGTRQTNLDPANKRLVRRLNSTAVSKYDLSGSLLYRETNDYTYDAYARIDTQTTRVSNAAGAMLKTTTIDNDYAPPLTAQWLLSLPSRIAVTEDSTAAANSSTGQNPPLLSKVSRWSYDSSGVLQREWIEAAGAEEMATVYGDYDRFGHAQTVTVSGRAVAPRRTTVRYSDDGRFAIGGSNALGQSTGSVMFWQAGDGMGGGAYPGLVKQSQDANGVITVYQYDGFGRSSRVVAGVKAGLLDAASVRVTETVYRRCTESGTQCPERAVYAVETLSQTGSTGAGGVVVGTAYMDVLGREVRKTVTAPLGDMIVVDREYDVRGNAYRVSDPYFASAPVTRVWNTMSYDSLDRLVATVQGVDGRVDSVAYSGLVVTTRRNVGGLSGEQDVRVEKKNALGQTVEVVDAQGAALQYGYDSAGRLLKTIAPGNIETAIAYDAMGRKAAMTDRDKGSWTYRYNGVGELVLQTSARLQKTCMVYDALGRVVERVDEYAGNEASALSGCTDPGSTASRARWAFGTAAPEFGQLKSVGWVSGGVPYSEARRYDEGGRLVQVTKTIDGQSYAYGTTYDDYSRPQQLTYPGGLAVRTRYNARGFAYQSENAVTGQLYHMVRGMDAKGRLTEESFGNGVATLRSYDEARRERTIDTGSVAGRAQTIRARYNALGNLVERSDAVQGYAETFTYDESQRLTRSRGVFGTDDTRTGDVSYDVHGNIRSKLASGGSATPALAIASVGQYVYGGDAACTGNTRPHAICKINNGTAFKYDANGNMTAGDGKTIAYSSYDLPTSIQANGTTSSIRYAPDHQRYWRQDVGNGTTVTTVQVDALYEKVTTRTGTATTVEERHYIGGAAVVTISNRGTANASTQTRYLHTDMLGTPTAITDENGQVAELQLYDAWGRRTTPNLQTLVNLAAANSWRTSAMPRIAASQSSVTTRGFTGHEMFDAVGIIHMNGRIYDPRLGRFLQADPVVQAPDDLQAYNRYAYVRNNPLTLVDPSGYSWLSDAWHDFVDEVKDVLDASGFYSWLNETRKSITRETGRVFEKVPELQAVANAILVVYCPAALPYFNAAVSMTVNYQSGGSFADGVTAAATGYVLGEISAGMSGMVGKALGGGVVGLAGQQTSAIAFSAAVTKAQGGTFNFRSYLTSFAVSMSAAAVVESFAVQQGRQASIAGNEEAITYACPSCVEESPITLVSSWSEEDAARTRMLKDFNVSISDAYEMGSRGDYRGYITKVSTRGDWDYKNNALYNAVPVSEREYFGNFAFGATSQAWADGFTGGFSSSQAQSTTTNLALRGAGFYQEFFQPSLYRAENGHFYDIGTVGLYGDNPGDGAAIMAGAKYYYSLKR